MRGLAGSERRSPLLRATAELMWAAASPFPDARAVGAAAAAEFDEALLVRAALEQWVAPLVWRALSKAGTTTRLSEAGAAALRREAARWSAKAFFVPRTLRLAVEPLAAAGLEPVVMKGAALAERYPGPGLRPMGDIDLLLPPAAHAAAVAALRRAGWTVAGSLDRLRHETTLVHPEAPTLTLELHAGLERWHERVTRLDGASLWRRRTPAVLMGTPAFTLTPEDELIVLAAHAGKPFHCFDRLMWFADLPVVIEGAGRGVDWELVRRRAADLLAATILSVALRQGRRLGARVPEEALAPLPGRGWRATVLAGLLTDEWPLHPPDPATRRRARYALCETVPRRALLFLGETPHEPLWRQPAILGNRMRLAAGGLPRLRRGATR